MALRYFYMVAHNVVAQCLPAGSYGREMICVCIQYSVGK